MSLKSVAHRIRIDGGRKDWCRRGESNLRLTLIRRKLFILRNARHAKNAKSPLLGYAGAKFTGTRSSEPKKVTIYKGPPS